MSSPRPVLGLLLGLLGATSAVAAERVADRIVAVVGDEVIALSEVYEAAGGPIDAACPDPMDRACRAAHEPEILDELIRRELMRQELVELGVDVGQAEVERTVQQMVAEFGFADREGLRADVESRGLSWERFQSQQVLPFVRERQFAQVVLRHRVGVSRDEAFDLYQRRIREVEAPQIAYFEALAYRLPADVDAQGKADAVQELRAALAEVRAGERTWDDVVATYDTGGIVEVTRGKGFAEGELMPVLADLAFDTEIGDVGGPRLDGTVLYAARVDRREAGEIEAPPFEEVEAQLMEAVFQQKVERVADVWYQQARRRASIRILVEDARPAWAQPDVDDAEPEAPPAAPDRAATEG